VFQKIVDTPLVLPTPKQIVIRNEVDRFGFSYVLAERFGFSRPPLSFACFLHGWMWRRDLKIEDLGYYFTPRCTPIIVTNAHQAAVVKASGFSVVVEGGLPFIYIPESGILRRPRSLLIMPPHSLSYYGCGLNSYDNLLTYVKSIEGDFSEVYFCIHADDAHDQVLLNKMRESNIRFIIGASANDANSLKRMRRIFDYFDFVTTTVIGSHILYAAFCGCKISILNKYFFTYPETAFDKYGYVNRIPGCKQRYIDVVNNKDKLIEQLPWLFVRDPGEALQMINWANEEIGVNNLLSRDQLLELLGWSGVAKVKAVNRILVRRFFSLFK
jgi:hypothetical protein